MKQHKSLLIICFTLFITFVMSCSTDRKIHSETKPAIEFSNTAPANWVAIDSLLLLNRYKSADTLLQSLLLTIKTSDVNNQLKGLHTKLHILNKTTEDPILHQLKYLDHKIETLEAPFSTITRLIKANKIFNYFNYRNQNTNGGSEGDNILTWSNLTKQKYAKKEVELASNDLPLLNELSSSLLDSAQFSFINLDTVISPEFKYQIMPTLAEFLLDEILDITKNKIIPDNSITPIHKQQLRKLLLVSNEEFSKITLDSLPEKSLFFLELIQKNRSILDSSILVQDYFFLKRFEYVIKQLNPDQEEKILLYKKLIKKLPSKNQVFVYVRLNSFYLQNYSENKNYLEAEANCAQILSKWPNDIYLKKYVKKVSDLIHHKEFKIELISALSPSIDIPIHITARNMKEIPYRIYKRENTDFEEYTYRSVEDNIWNKTPDYEGILKVVQGENYQEISTIQKITALPKGRYLILFATTKSSDNENFEFVQHEFNSTNLSVSILRKEGNKSILHVSDRKTGESIKGAQIRVYNRKWEYQKYRNELLSKLTTDKNGNVSIRNADRNALIVTEYDSSVLVENFHFYNSNYSEPKDEHHSKIFTDRSVYRPGQTVQFKGIVYRGKQNKFSVSKSKKIEVKLFDANYQEVSKQLVSTNSFGSYSGEFTLPTGALNGHFTIRDSYTTAGFKVEAYKRPKFEVTFDTLKSRYQLNEKVTVSGKAISFSGAAIQQAKVNYKINRNVYRPFYGYYNRSSYHNGASIDEGIVETNDKGEFQITFELSSDEDLNSKNQISNFSIEAEVTDISGETQSGSTSIKAAEKRVFTSILFPSTNSIDNIDPLKISTTNANQISIPAKGIYQISKLEKELKHKPWYSKIDTHLISIEDFGKEFPYYAYTDEQSNYKSKQVVIQKSWDTKNKKDFDISSLSKYGSGDYQIEVITKHHTGDSDTTQQYFQLIDESATKADITSFLTAYSSKKKIKTGETIQFVVSSSLKKAHVHYDIYAGNKLMTSKKIILNNEQQLLSYKVPTGFYGHIDAKFYLVAENNQFQEKLKFYIPNPKRKLQLKLKTFRDKITPGQEEKWSIEVKRENETIPTEMLATMYDASLDQFSMHQFNWNLFFDINNSFNIQLGQSFEIDQKRSTSKSLSSFTIDQLNGNIYQNIWHNGLGWSFKVISLREKERASPRKYKQEMFIGNSEEEKALAPDLDGRSEILFKDKFSSNLISQKDDKETRTKTPIAIRKNLQETAFFYPHLIANKKGVVDFSFPAPEALTKWKLLAVAHSNDLGIGQLEATTITQKELMISPHLPRFVKKGDKIVFSSKVINLSKKALSGEVNFELFDPSTSKIIEQLKSQSFSLEAKQNGTFEWNYTIPSTYQNIGIRTTASSSSHSDGEERVLPVLSDEKLVTETLPITISTKGEHQFELKSVQNPGSRNGLSYSVQITENPAWHAILALPYLIEYPYECSEQLFSRIYANSIAGKLLKDNPKIHQLVEEWGNLSENEQISALEINQDLKSILLKETPWVRDAQNETKQRAQIAQLMEFSKLKSQLDEGISKLIKQQNSDGGWPWFKNLRSDPYITSHLVAGFGKLNDLGILTNEQRLKYPVNRAISYLDNFVQQEHKKQVKDPKKSYRSNTIIHIQYARSFFPDKYVSEKVKAAYAYFSEKDKKKWHTYSPQIAAITAITFNKKGDTQTAKNILLSLKEQLIHKKNYGSYLKQSSNRYYWQHAPIETQALLIQAFNLIDPDAKEVEQMNLWLLNQKRTNKWPTTKATTEAIYALLTSKSFEVSSSKPLSVKVGNQEISSTQKTNLTGFYEKKWTSEEIKPELGNITISQETDALRWGAVYYQYLQNISDIVSSGDSTIRIQKEIYRLTSENGKEKLEPATNLKKGDRLRIKLTFRTDRDLQYVHIKDGRSANFEPVSSSSGAQYGGGIYHYKNVSDASTSFFFNFVRKGSYVFEHDVYVTHSGNFTGGIAEIECMYAPEFKAHSIGKRIEVK